MTTRLSWKQGMIWWFGVGCLLAISLPACAQEPETVVPTPREGSWMDLHRSFLARAKRADKEPINLLFLGDSITQGWNDNAIWNRFYGPRNAANFGIGGDRTQHVLWRIKNGELDGIAPKVVVLMIGTNNADNATAEEITLGITANIQELRKRLPKTKILLLSIFPRDDRRIAPIRNEIHQKINSVNQVIAKLDDGANIRFLDISKAFLDADGKITPEIMPDFLHLSTKGYRIWADSMEPTLWQMLDESR